MFHVYVCAALMLKYSGELKAMKDFQVSIECGLSRRGPVCCRN